MVSGIGGDWKSACVPFSIPMWTLPQFLFPVDGNDVRVPGLGCDWIAMCLPF
jgi:hypothetical protein